MCGEMEQDALLPPRPCPSCDPLSATSGKRPPPPWKRVVFYAQYAGALRACILAYKLEKRLGLGSLLQRLLLEAWAYGADLSRMPSPELIVPVPLHPGRLRTRGFNQSLELARPLARRTGASLSPGALRRIRPTLPQFTLQRHERARNMQGAFAADTSLVRGCRVLLVDDIMTTGATLLECADTLRSAGAKRIDLLVLARAAGHGPFPLAESVVTLG